MQMDNKKCGEVMMVVDKTKTLVPVQAEELEATRDAHSLAVHGITAGTTEDHVKDVFPRARQVTIAKRGGSAFLNYATREECQDDFLTKEDAVVNGVSVVVMFGHHLKGSDRQVDKLEDLRERVEVSRNKSSWAPLLKFFVEIRIKMKNGQVVVDDSSSLAEMNEVLLSSGFRMDRMRKQFRRSRGEEEMMEIKIGWLDQLMARVCEKSELSASDRENLERGRWRQMVEDIWRYFDSNRDIEVDDEWEGISERRKNEACTRSSSQSGRSSSYMATRQVVKRDRSRSLEWRGRARDSRDQESGRRLGSNSSRSRKDRSRSRRRECSRSRSKTTFSEVDHLHVLDRQDKEGMMNNNHQQMGSIRNDDIVTPVLEEEHYVQNNNSSLARYLGKKLRALGLKEDTVVLEADKIMITIRQVVEEVGTMSSIQQCELMKLMSKFGYKSGHVSERLAADLVVEWAGKEEKEDEKAPIIKDDEVGLGVDPDEHHEQGIPREIMGVEEGYPRMALVMAFFLHTERGLEEQTSKDLARAMVGVWITYGFTYQQMCEVCQTRDQEEVKGDRLRNMLNTKLSEGFVKPMSFGFSKLIKLTLFYFSNAV